MLIKSMLCISCGFASIAMASAKPSDVQALGDRLMSNFPKAPTIDTSYKEKTGDREIPSLRSQDWIILPHPMSLAESFSKEHDAIVTLFVRADDEFIRLSTTEKGEKAGSALPRIHPAYPHLMKEDRYTAKMVFADKPYMADYNVFRDEHGKVIGAYLVAIPCR